MAKKKKRKTKISKAGIIVICSTVLGVMTVALGGGYLAGRALYANKFLEGTVINNQNVGGKSFDEACEMFGTDESVEPLSVKTIDGQTFTFEREDFGYYTNANDELRKIYDMQDHNKWFMGFAGGYNYTFDEVDGYDKKKLKKALDETNWGDVKTQNAKISYGDDKCEVTKEIQGNEVTDKDKLASYVESQVDKGNYQVVINEKTGCYTLPKITSTDLQQRCDNINSVYGMSVTYDFDYTTETLKGERLVEMLEINDDGTYSVDEEKAMAYVDELAKKYDTYNTERKFHATLQGDIVVPTSDDAKYGWWIDKERTCSELIDMLYAGNTVDSIDPVYYETDGGYVFTGNEAARSTDDDIGDTYIEIDLTEQYLWYYKKGKLQYESYIVSGQTTSLTRTTLPGCYKVWFKATNYRMKDTNADGDSWDTTCNYWNQIAIVGIGLHDSTWRGGFGGTIYQYNGSHGCINLPYETAQYIYNNVDYDTPVILYYKSADSKADTPYGL